MFGPGLYPKGGQTPSEASSDFSMTSSARVIMDQVALLDKDSGQMMKQIQQQQPPAPQPAARPQPETNNLTFLVPVKSSAQQHRPQVNPSNSPKHSRPSSPAKSHKSFRSDVSVNSAVARDIYAAAKARNDRLHAEV